MFTILHIITLIGKKDFCVKKGPKKDHYNLNRKQKGPKKDHYNLNRKKKDFCVKKGPKKDHFSSLVLKRTKSLIKDLYASTGHDLTKKTTKTKTKSFREHLQRAIFETFAFFL